MSKYKLLNILDNDMINLSTFNCIPEKSGYNVEDFKRINEFLFNENKALKYARDNIYKTFLLIDTAEGRIAGYYSICTGSKTTYKAFKKEKKVPTISNNKELPTIDVIWFGIDKKYQGQHLGSALLRIICKSVFRVSHDIGICFLAVDSLYSSKEFYEKIGFMDIGESHKKKEDLWMGWTIPEIEIFLNE
ncbi:GNAT family N-acetyltransferase [Companilactobacillus kimchiensis]|uniref:N-acetyltransferase domain-containing protein n=1 Tax=Companilactobacillus kimchiensis TaxID=993692 RepID=A0A0R2LES2_9LACO|nr:GNAT family N-acetyltransferase [Companilactobacillus kimchiensis]KRO00318.1 hypothetical protein IV57_GL001421 [Companilactobacillus kimchiensis]